jgi:hypothetical protein
LSSRWCPTLIGGKHCADRQLPSDHSYGGVCLHHARGRRRLLPARPGSIPKRALYDLMQAFLAGIAIRG